MRLMLMLALICAPLLCSQDDPVRKPAPKAGQSDILDGEEAFARGEMGKAVEHFTAALKAQPENDEVYAYRAAAYVALGESEKADADLAEAMKLDTTFSLAWNTRGYLHWLRDEFQLAIDDYTAAIAYAADDRRVDTGGRAQMYQNRGVAWQDAGNTDRALLDFDQCIKLLPDEPAFYENRGLIYVDKQLFDVAFRDFDRALELDPKNARGYVNRAWTARLMGDLEQSVRDYSQALRLKPEYAQARIGRGYTWLAWKREEMATTDFQAATKIEGFAAAGHAGLGEVALAGGKLDVAEQEFSSARMEDTYCEAAWFGLARVQFTRKKYKLAAENARSLCRMAPRQADYWRLLADILFADSDSQGAVAALNRLIALSSGDMSALKLRLRCLCKLGLYETARGDAQRIGETATTEGLVEDTRVCILEAADGWKKFALACLNTAKSLGAELSGLAEDADFAALKDDPEFKALLTK
ncbi:MAG: tetratricopeptide repeat protein [Planctomycetes bacterium]|nr:tetratricopeptide repeat protein [Planctomycetota bacterium]